MFILISTWLPQPKIVGTNRLVQFLGGAVISALSMVVGATGPLIASVSYGARKEDSREAFRRAMELNPAGPSAYTELANAKLRFGGKTCMDDARALYRQAAGLTPHDAKERLEIERAKRHLEV